MVWVPELGAEEKHVSPALKAVPDDRATHYWDGGGLLMRGYSPVLALPTFNGTRMNAWDLYMIYGPESRWTAVLPPKPEYWMHQLFISDDNTEFLDAGEFAAQAELKLKKLPASRSATKTD